MLFGVLSILASAATQAWLFVEVGGTMRKSCEGIGTESLVALVSSVLLVLIGYCCQGMPGKTFLSAGFSAVTVLFLSRLTVLVQESDRLCDAVGLPADDIVISADTRERAAVAAWASISLLAVGLLLLHCVSSSRTSSSYCSWFDCFGCASDDDCDDDARPVRRWDRRDYGFVDTEN